MKFAWILLAMGCASCATGGGLGPPDPATTQPAAADPDWQTVARVIGRDGAARGDVYVVTIPRADLDVSVEGMSVPTEAGIESEFRFFRCTCGKMRVFGQFVVADYEANDVVDALARGISSSALSVRSCFTIVRGCCRSASRPRTRPLNWQKRCVKRWAGQARSDPPRRPCRRISPDCFTAPRRPRAVPTHKARLERLSQ